MTYSMTLDYPSEDQIIAEAIAAVAKFYATTAIVHFCINCWIISEQFQTINDQIKQLPQSSNLATQLRFIQNNHILISRSVELLNESFEMILWLEMLFLFTIFTNNFIRILVNFYGSLLHNNVTVWIILSASFGNVMLASHSAERIRTKVFLIRIIIYCCLSEFIYFSAI